MCAVQSDGAPIAGPADHPRGVPAVPVGTRIGRYEVRGLLGAGGMGAVYDAYDADLDRAVALKVLRAELGDVPGFADRLVHESRLTAKVAHASVIAVYDAGREGDTVFIAMELIRGGTLTAWLAANRLDWRAIVVLFERAGDGLAAAHKASIVHRDFKPDSMERYAEAEPLLARACDVIMLTAPTVLGGDLVMPVVIAFHRRYPDVVVEVELTDRVVETDLATGRLTSLLTEHIPVRRTIYAIYATSRLLPAKTRAFLDVLETSFRIRRPTTEEIFDS